MANNLLELGIEDLQDAIYVCCKTSGIWIIPSPFIHDVTEYGEQYSVIIIIKIHFRG